MNTSPANALPNLKIVADEQLIAAAIKKIADEAVRRYSAPARPLFVPLLEGAVPFAADLFREIRAHPSGFDPDVKYMQTSRYGDETHGKQTKIVMDLPEGIELAGRTVVVVDDLLDGGDTFSFVANHLKQRGAAKVELIVLLQKDRPDLPARPDAAISALTAPNRWLVGKGMNGRGNTYRWLPYIAIDLNEDPDPAA
jgi:hypoxanthine phosphoribosyltransferase